MTAVLPHAPPEKTAVPKHKGLDPLAAKSGVPASLHSTAHKGKFQQLMDQAAPKATVPAPPAGSGKPKVLPQKAAEHAPEKPKEAKKHDPKEVKSDAVLASLVQPGVLLPKSDPVNKPQKSPETDSLLSSTEKAKNQRAERRTAAETGRLVAWNPGSLETVRNRGPVQGTSVRSERSDEKPKVFVVDRRTEAKEKEKLKLPGAETAAMQPVPTSADPQAAKTADSKNDQVQVSFQAVSGKAQGQGSFDIQPQNTPVSSHDAASFQQYLVERGYGQMVDQARIVLRDQNAGEIRMTLFPESLGKVKVKLNLTDSSLAGQIFVENQTVKDVFQANMDNLLQAFRDGGWNDLSLQVSVGGEKGPGNGGQPSHQAPQAQDYGRQVAQTVSDGPVNRIGYWNDRQINLTA